MRRAPLLLMSAALLVVGCSGSDDDAGPSTTRSSVTSAKSSTSTSSTSSTTGSTTDDSSSPSTPTPGPCTTPKAGPPPGAAVGSIPDVDGDGRDDRSWVLRTDGGGDLGIVTAAGGGDSTSVRFATGGPVHMFVMDAAHAGGTYVIAGDGRVDPLFSWEDCHLDPVQGEGGEPYAFDLGQLGNGNGVGCATIGGEPSLVGLKIVSEGAGIVKWTRTRVEVDGNVARNGATDAGSFARPTDQGAIELLRTISCGDRTMRLEGITAG